MLRIIFFFIIIVLPVSAEMTSENVAHIIFSSDCSIRTIALHSLTGDEFALVKDSIDFGATYLPQILSDSWPTWKPSEFNYLWRIDFSGDGNPDFIQTGFFVSEAPLTFLWIYDGTGYKLHDQLDGEVIRLVRETPYDSYSIILEDGWCCAGYIGYYTLLRPVWFNNRFTYTTRMIIAQFRNTKIPPAKTMERNFTVEISECLLRETPEKIDTYDSLFSEIENLPVYGNIVARFPVGAMGIAFAEENDSTGLPWFFVTFDDNLNPTYSRFYGDSAAYLCGWVDSASIEFVK
ncbi:MAG: hypothetical protein HRF51_06270 [bacterium]